jgi:hypothetical protein
VFVFCLFKQNVQSLGGSLFDRLLPLRLGTAQERVHLLPVLVKHLQCTDLAFFGRFALPLLSRIPALGALLPALAVLPADVVQVKTPPLQNVL